MSEFKSSLQNILYDLQQQSTPDEIAIGHIFNTVHTFESQCEPLKVKLFEGSEVYWDNPLQLFNTVFRAVDLCHQFELVPEDIDRFVRQNLNGD